MGTISFMALFALYFDIFWWYLSHISLLWRLRKPEDVEKTSTILGQEVAERVLEMCDTHFV